MRDWTAELERQRIGWWLVGLFLLAVVWTFAAGFVGTFVLGLFVYYGARPVHRWLLGHISSRSVAAVLTMLVIVVPALLLLTYVGIVAVREFTKVVGEDVIRKVGEYVPFPGSPFRAVQDPLAYLSQINDLDALVQQLSGGLETLGIVTTGLVHLTLALAFAFFLLRDGNRAERWFRAEVGGRGSVPYAFLSAVDADLETVYFGNVVTVLLVTVLSVVVYNGYNFVAPDPVSLPFPTLLALLTGLATFIPLVVGKVVYLPVTAFLGWQAVQSGSGLVWVVAFVVVAFLFLDLFPMAVLRPVISGRSLHAGMVLFAYILGAAYFGWYGLFLGPLLLVLLIQFLKVVFPELLHGDRLTATPSSALSLGHDPVATDRESVEPVDDDAESSSESEDEDETRSGSPGEAASE